MITEAIVRFDMKNPIMSDVDLVLDSGKKIETNFAELSMLIQSVFTNTKSEHIYGFNSGESAS
jgi:hypothetical protein